MMVKREISPRDAVTRWLDSLRSQRSEETVSSYWYRLKLFVEWCEDHDDIEHMSDIGGWELDSYGTHRRSITDNTNTLKGELTTLKNFLEYAEKIEIVDEPLSEKVTPPTVPKDEQASAVKLDTDDALALLEFYRTDQSKHASRQHALLEVLWHTGARLGEVRALDVEDLEALPDGDRHYLVFRNRQESGTRLKKGDAGERPVLLSDTGWSVLQTYIDRYRVETTDDYGREPLFTSSQGRASKNALRQWTYEATVPCLHSPCPHDNDPDTCEHLEHNMTSGCPSSRSPHQIRTGAITWMRDKGISEEQVAGRVNASVETIRNHYDKQDPVREMLERRASATEDLDISLESDTNDE